MVGHARALYSVINEPNSYLNAHATDKIQKSSQLANSLMCLFTTID